MAFSTYKDGDIVDLGNQTWTVDVQADGASDQGTIQFAANPLVLEAVDDRPELPWGIIRTSCEVRTVAEDSLFSTMRDADYKTYKIVISSDAGSLGSYNFWADTKGMRQRIAYNSYNILRGSDGIDTLKSVPWYESIDDAYADGPRKTVMEIFADIMGNIGLEMGFHVVFDWCPNTTGMLADGRALERISIDVAWLYTKLLGANGGTDNSPRFVSAYDVLDHLLCRFHLKLSQIRGSWYLFQRPAHAEDYVVYNSSGTYVSTASYSRIETFDEATPYHTIKTVEYEIGSAASYETLQGVFDYDTVGSLLDDPTFRSINDSANPRWQAFGGVSASLRDGLRRVLYIAGATGNASVDDFTASQCVDVVDDPADDFVRSNWSQATLEAQDTNYIEFSCRATYRFLEALRTSTQPDVPHYAMVSIEASSTGDLVDTANPADRQYLQDAQDGNNIYNQWGTGEAVLPFEIEEYGDQILIRIKAQMNTSYLTAGNDYQFRVALYGAVDTAYGANSDTYQVAGIEWEWPTFEYFLDDEAESAELISTWTNDQDAGVEALTGIVWYVGDGPHAGSRSSLVHDSAGEETQNWNVGAVASGDDLDTLWMDQVLTQFSSCPQTLSLSVTLVNAASPANHQLSLAHCLTFGASHYCPSRVRWHAKFTEYEWSGVEITDVAAATSIVQEEGNERQGRWVDEMPSNEGPECWMSAGPTFIDNVTSVTATGIWFKANRRCNSIKYLITTSSTWSLVGGTTIAVGKGQAKAVDETGLDFETTYYIHYQGYTQSDAGGISGAQLSETFTTPISRIEVLDQLCICRDAGSVSGASVTLSLGDGGDDIPLRENVYAGEPLMFVPAENPTTKHWIEVDADAYQDGTSVDITFTGGSQTYADGGFVLAYSKTLQWLRTRLQGEASAGKVPFGYDTSDLVAWYGMVKPLDADLILDWWIKDGELNNAYITGTDMSYTAAGLLSVATDTNVELDTDLAPLGNFMIVGLIQNSSAAASETFYSASWDSGTYTLSINPNTTTGRFVVSMNDGTGSTNYGPTIGLAQDEDVFFAVIVDRTNGKIRVMTYTEANGPEYSSDTFTSHSPSAVDYARLPSNDWLCSMVAVHDGIIPFAALGILQGAWFLRQLSAVSRWAKSAHGIDLKIIQYDGEDEPPQYDYGPLIGVTHDTLKGATTTCNIIGDGIKGDWPDNTQLIFEPLGVEVPQVYRTALNGAVSDGASSITVDSFTITAYVGANIYVAAKHVHEEQKEWSADLVFSATDSDTIAWTSGDLYLESGLSYAISLGNTGNMAATTWIYFDPAASTSVLQTSTTFSDATGHAKVIIAIASPSAYGLDASVVVRRGFGIIDRDQLPADIITETKISDDSISTPKLQANCVTAAKIAANTITANEIQAASITATELNIATLSAITANLGTVTAGSISGVTATFGSGDEVYFDSDGQHLIIDTDTLTDANSIQWWDESVSGTPVAELYTYRLSGQFFTYLRNRDSNGHLYLDSDGGTTLSGQQVTVSTDVGNVVLSPTGTLELTAGITEATPDDADELLWLDGTTVKQVDLRNLFDNLDTLSSAAAADTAIFYDASDGYLKRYDAGKLFVNAVVGTGTDVANKRIGFDLDGVSYYVNVYEAP